VCGAGASLCLSDAQPRLGISALRDNRKILMVPALGEKQAEVMADPLTCCVASAERGQGAVVMTNSDDGWIVFDEIFHAIAIEYGWPITDEHAWLNYVAPNQPWAEADSQNYSTYGGIYA